MDKIKKSPLARTSVRNEAASQESYKNVVYESLTKRKNIEKGKELKTRKEEETGSPVLGNKGSLK
jgi:hypothetical protein